VKAKLLEHNSMGHKMGMGIVMQQHNAFRQLSQHLLLSLSCSISLQHALFIVIPILVEVWTSLSQDITFLVHTMTFALWFSVVD
jgi:hypothetical protein